MPTTSIPWAWTKKGKCQLQTATPTTTTTRRKKKLLTEITELIGLISLSFVHHMMGMYTIGISVSHQSIWQWFDNYVMPNASFLHILEENKQTMNKLYFVRKRLKRCRNNVVKWSRLTAGRWHFLSTEYQQDALNYKRDIHRFSPSIVLARTTFSSLVCWLQHRNKKRFLRPFRHSY